MNITHAPQIGSIPSRTSRYLVGAVVVGLAIGAAILAVTNIGSSGSSARPARTTAAASLPFFPPVSHELYVTYYVVASDADRAAAESTILEAARERMAAGLDDPNLSFTVVQFRTPEEEAAFSVEVNDVMASDPNLHARIVDERGKGGPAAVQASSFEPVPEMGVEWCKAQAPDEATRNVLRAAGYC